MARQSNVELKDRHEAVLSLLRREEPAAVIARRIGVSEPTLYRWRDEFLAAGEAALANGSGKKGADPRDRRIAELEAQIELASPAEPGGNESGQVLCPDRLRTKPFWRWSRWRRRIPGTATRRSRSCAAARDTR
jgi:transposase-like protein